MLPNFIGIGAPKAGTTWLAACLAEHPDVYMAPVKEVNFLHYMDIEGRLPEYEAHFAGARGQKAVGEISVRYLNSPRAPGRIKELMPEARLFVSLRNPVDQIYSNYWHLQRQGFHEPTGKANLSLDEAVERHDQILVEPARYAKHLRHWIELFGSERIHVILFDDIEQSPEKVLSGLYGFLGVDASFRPAALGRRDRSTRAGTSPRNEWMEAAYQKVYRSLTAYAYAPLKRAVGVRRAAMLKDRLRARELMERVFRKSGYAPLSAAQRRKLAAMVSPDVAELEALLGRDLPAWREKAVASAERA